MSTESIIDKSSVAGQQSYGSVSTKEMESPQPMPRLSAIKNGISSPELKQPDLKQPEQEHQNEAKDDAANDARIESKQQDDQQQQQPQQPQPAIALVRPQQQPEGERKSPPTDQLSLEHPLHPEASAPGNEVDLPPVPPQREHHYRANNNNQKNASAGPRELESGASETSIERPYPKYVFFIIANEFCERFSFYGMRTILVLYFRNVLGFTETSSKVAFHLFITLCYFTPVLGAILGDSIWGKYHTILYLSIVYFVGELFLVISSILWESKFFSIGLTIISLVLIGSGTGGIKPCVSALSGDQFLPNEQKRIQNFFSMFYFSINAGSLISTYLTPVLRNDIHCGDRQDCFPLAFGVPCLLMLMALILFVMARSKYTIVPLPKDNILVTFVKCIYHAIRIKWRRPLKSSKSTNGHQLVDSSEANLVVELANNNKKKPITDIDNNNNNGSLKPMPILGHEPPEHWIYYARDRYDKRTLDEFRSVLGVLVLFLPLPVFWCLFDQQSSSWTLQATRMDGHALGLNLKPDQIQVANPLLLLAMIPLFDMFIYPLFNKCGILKTPLQRMTAGGVLASLAFFVSAFIEQRIDYYKPSTDIPNGQVYITLTNGMGNCDMNHQNFLMEHHQPSRSQYVVNEIIGQQQQQVMSKSGVNNTLEPIISAYSSEEEAESSSLLHESDRVIKLPDLSPLQSKMIGLIKSDTSYKLIFNVATPKADSMNLTDGVALQSVVGCPLTDGHQYFVNVSTIESGHSKIIYVYQGNSDLFQMTFDDNIAVPSAGKANVKLILDLMTFDLETLGNITIEATGDKKGTTRHQFTYQPKVQSSNTIATTNTNNNNNNSTGNNNLLATDYLQVDAQNTNDFTLLLPESWNQEPFRLQLEPGSRYLVLIHEYEPMKYTIKLEQLQDNEYMISVLWQLIPYILISAGELMFSITGLEFSYSAAPKSMKSVIFGAWYLTTAFGNILTVAVESLRIFDGFAAESNFYATIMLLDMVVFALIAYYFIDSISIGINGSRGKKPKSHNKKYDDQRLTSYRATDTTNNTNNTTTNNNNNESKNPLEMNTYGKAVDDSP